MSLRLVACPIARAALLLLVVASSGCGRQAQIERYQVPKPQLSGTTSSAAAEGLSVPDPGQVSRGGATGFDSSVLQCDPPASWQPTAVGGMRKAAYRVDDDGRGVEITVISALGDLKDNVNRWRDQVKLPPLPEVEIKDQISEISVGNQAGKYVELLGPKSAQPREAILAVIVEADGRQWFVKLRGDADLALREKSRFQQFVRSLQFNQR